MLKYLTILTAIILFALIVALAIRSPLFRNVGFSPLQYAAQVVLSVNVVNPNVPAPTPPAPVAPAISGGGGGGAGAVSQSVHPASIATVAVPVVSPLPALPNPTTPTPALPFANARMQNALSVPQPTVQFTRDLSLGSSGADVKLLQQFLNTHGFPIALTGPGSPGQETGSFGAKTQLALKRFQTLYAPQIGATNPNGTLGPKTRTFIQTFSAATLTRKQTALSASSSRSATSANLLSTPISFFQALLTGHF
jgi:peptidoglycan hydrolase-like protein with peptidoglycan-binding domain